MPHYHATWEDNLPSIIRHGLGGAAPGSRNFDCEGGVYLATDPSLAVSFLIEAAVRQGASSGMTPADAMASMRLIVIDDTRLDWRLASPDPNIEREGIAIIYHGVVDVTGMPVLEMDEVLAGVPRL